MQRLDELVAPRHGMVVSKDATPFSFPIRWTVSISNADNSPWRDSFVRNAFSHLNTTSFFTRLEGAGSKTRRDLGESAWVFQFMPPKNSKERMSNV